MTSLASAPIQERTLTGLSVLLQSSALKRALQPYCLGGPYGRLLDAEFERLGEASVQTFETEGLIGTGAAPAVLAYLFHRIGDRLDGRPTLLIVDEGWLALDDEDFAGQLREWLKTLRKKNASVIFATQSLSDIDVSSIAPAIIESCPTRILLPNERAIEPQITAIRRWPSRRASTRRVHILVKPTRASIETNLVVNTDRRTYLIELRSREKPYMPSVAWYYPEDRRGRARSVPLTPVLPDPTQRRFRYAIEGDSPPWRPLTAYDDARKVYIEFPQGIVQGEMPPLFVIGHDGKTEIVNYRAHGNVLIIDRLFAAAELRLGGEHQQKVRIVRTDGRSSS